MTAEKKFCVVFEILGENDCSWMALIGWKVNVIALVCLSVNTSEKGNYVALPLRCAAGDNISSSLEGLARLKPRRERHFNISVHSRFMMWGRRPKVPICLFHLQLSRNRQLASALTRFLTVHAGSSGYGFIGPVFVFIHLPKWCSRSILISFYCFGVTLIVLFLVLVWTVFYHVWKSTLFVLYSE